ncbi:hypothetical protein EJC49_15215 [Aquibium carbonis]|jgi:hypothetical protein|uniref:DUF2269 domain-containing protein n=1 Tax=Aquibium carbonis TaxID=2495581 RepID=A0A3R9Y6T3_9HYPH|nr:hypothetical protein [Aquibium carbonis]RST85442.1 hypothetical protein EJC49_15215 [Aquibium carbonis]
MGPRLRRLLLTLHVGLSVASIGAVAAFLALASAALFGAEGFAVHGAYAGAGIVTWWVILPLVVAALVTGTIQALATQWGLFRHYWVLAKLVLTAVTLAVLILQLGGIETAASNASARGLASLGSLPMSLALHATGGLAVLSIVTALSIFKPQGLTRYGWRKQKERSGQRRR